MKQLLTVLALAAVVAAPVAAREIIPYSGTPLPEPEGACTALEYDGGDAYLVGFGTYYGWTQNTVVNFQAPAAGSLDEAQFYVYSYAGNGSRDVDFYSLPSLNSNPGGFGSSSLGSWTPPTSASGFVVVPVSQALSAGEIFGVGTAIFPGDVIAIYDAFADGNPGHSWSLFFGTWYDDTNDFGSDDGIRACVSGGTPTLETTWGGIKNLYR